MEQSWRINLSVKGANESLKKNKLKKFSICHSVFVPLTENSSGEAREIVVVVLAVDIEGILWPGVGLGVGVVSVGPALAVKILTVAEGPALAGVEGELVEPMFPGGCVASVVASLRLLSVTVILSVPGNHTGSDDVVPKTVTNGHWSILIKPPGESYIILLNLILCNLENTLQEF